MPNTEYSIKAPSTRIRGVTLKQEFIAASGLRHPIVHWTAYSSSIYETPNTLRCHRTTEESGARNMGITNVGETIRQSVGDRADKPAQSIRDPFQ